MNPVRSLVPALGAGFLSTFSGPGEKLAFRPEAGTSLQKVFSIDGDFALDDLTLIVSGEDVGGMLGGFELSVKQGARYEITDVYRELAEGRPKELLRTFDTLTGSMHMNVSMAEESIPEMKSSSPLEGKTVAFRWNDEEADFDVSFHESEGDEELLEGLEEDMDLRAFLPTSEVAQGDSWSVELEALDCIAMPGGNLALVPEDEEVDEESMEMLEELFAGFGEDLADLLEGQCTCTYKGTQEEKGAQLAEIVLEIEVSTTFDMTELLEKVIQIMVEQSGGEAPELSLDTADLSLDYEGTGTLLWNVGAGRVHAFHLTGDATIGVDFEVSVEVEGESHDVSASIEMSGSMTEEVEIKE
jgi:hypothetical protein